MPSTSTWSAASASASDRTFPPGIDSSGGAGARFPRLHELPGSHDRQRGELARVETVALQQLAQVIAFFAARPERGRQRAGAGLRRRIHLWAWAGRRGRATQRHGMCCARVSPARRRVHRAAPGRRRASGGLPGRGDGSWRRRGPAAVRGARVPGLPAVRRVRGRHGALSVRGLRARAPGAVTCTKSRASKNPWPTIYV
jgi:hypothetical protein